MKVIKLDKDKETLVDDQDYESLSKYKWYFHLNRYVSRRYKKNGKSYRIYMHREILQAPKGMEVDHIDNNGLNNQRSNIRLATHAQNNQNKPIVRGYVPYYGVYWVKEKYKQKYVARISVNKKHHHLGYFGSAVCAALAYDEAARKLHGEFATTNFKKKLDKEE